MKKLLFLLFFFFIINVNANTCTNEEKTKLRNIVNNIEIEIELFDSEPIGGWGKVYDAYFFNMSDEIYIYNEDPYISVEYKEETTPFLLGVTPGEILKFDFYGSDKSKCSGELILSRLYSFPHYNFYSDNYLCEGIEEFELCKTEKDTKNISFEQFEQSVINYKESLIKENLEKENNKISIFDKIFDFLLKYYIFILYPIILLSIIGVILIKLKERKEIL